MMKRADLPGVAFSYLLETVMPTVPYIIPLPHSITTTSHGDGRCCRDPQFTKKEIDFERFYDLSTVTHLVARFQPQNDSRAHFLERSDQA